MAEIDPPEKKDFFISLQQGRPRSGRSGSRGSLSRQAATASRFRRGISEPGCNFVVEMDRAIQECDRSRCGALARLRHFVLHPAGVGGVFRAGPYQRADARFSPSACASAS